VILDSYQDNFCIIEEQAHAILESIAAKVVSFSCLYHLDFVEAAGEMLRFCVSTGEPK